MKLIESMKATVRSWYYRNPVSLNLTVLFFTFFLTTTIPSIVIINYFNQKATYDEMERFAGTAIDTAAMRLLETLDGGKKISTSILSMPSLHRLLEKDFGQRTPAETSALESSLYTICSTSTDKLSAYVYDLEGHCYYTDSFRTKKPLPSSRTASIYQEMERLQGGTMAVYTHSLYDSSSEHDGISIIRTINNLDTLQPVGTLIINLRISDLAYCFETTSERKTSYLLFDKSGEVLFSVPESLDVPVDSLVGEVTKNGIGETFRTTIGEHSFLAASSFVPDSGFYLAGMTEVRPAGIHRQKYFHYIAAVILINIVIMLAGLWILSRSLSAPLQRLAAHMRRLGEKDFSGLTSPYRSPNEIGLLAETYNQMTSEIQTLLQREVEIQKNKRHLELNLLQAQFRPHFLYNTIDTARSLCLQGELSQANLLLKAMGNYYQNILSKGKNVISIGDEINTIRQYEIIRGYKDDLELHIKYEIPDELLPMPILKFVLQPLIENSIKHGFRMCDSGQIVIRMELTDDVLSVMVSDNGTGIPADKLEELKNGGGRETKSFGLLATIERMKIYYGEAYAWNLESGPEGGTTVSFTIRGYSRWIPEDFTRFEEGGDLWQKS